MPFQSNIQLIKASYKEFLRKVAAAHRGDGAGEAGPAHYYVERVYAHADASLDASLARLQAQLLSAVDVGELRAAYQARKQRAKQRASQMRQAFDDKVSRLNSYLGCAGSSAGGGGAATAAAVTVGNAMAAAAAGAAQRGLAVAEATEAAQRSAGVASTSAARAAASDAASAAELESIFGSDGLLRRMVLLAVGSAARAYMTGLNSTSVEGGGHLAAALERPAGQALITVCNHVAALDDPLVVSALLPEAALQQPDKLRWTLCASDRCFRYAALVPLFRAAKVLPVVRGGGLAQPGMAAAESRLAAGDWVHIFPEGTRSPDGVTLGAVRKGVGRLVASVPEEAPPPLVVPFVHRGMEGVLPRGAVLPATGQKIDVMVGEPIPVADLLAAARAEAWPADRLHTAVAARVSHHLRDLTARLDARRSGLPDPGPSAAPDANSDAVSSLDQFDPSDLLLAAAAAERRRAGSGVWAAWERVKWRSALERPGGGSWATQGMATGVAAMQQQQQQMVPFAQEAASAALAGRGGSVVAGAAAGARVKTEALAGVAGGAPLMTGASPFLSHLLGWRQEVAWRQQAGTGYGGGGGGDGSQRGWAGREMRAPSLGVAGATAASGSGAVASWNWA
ncbi:hypothetical protein HYH02_006920 [Chlamydomonas schloesseri]|uniref:Phospholipid/glycerol acyltransferase domain-containing protein n=1 Tax=Chlamydomonas schloesseri TaxID=2026947 RepID=A0A835WJA9_9CHLO|nr:hypothetical protein HYH02_006920 [Chlamydomonas schloesseri]|eukprot:KAG2448338.1 hypothetical protein HYH02_006920 [Chlamydomonas schloesseri]